MRLPSLDFIVAVNAAVRRPDEWFDEPEEIDRVARALDSVNGIDQPAEAAASLAFRITRAQGFGEGNKRTAFIAARWVLDHNGVDGSRSERCRWRSEPCR